MPWATSCRATCRPSFTSRRGASACSSATRASSRRSPAASWRGGLTSSSTSPTTPGTAAPHQLLAHVTLRAVENRVPIVRAANTGVSAIIDPDGRIRWQGPLFEPLWHADEIAWQPVRTFYTRFGDVFAWTCALATLVGFGYGARRWRRRR